MIIINGQPITFGGSGSSTPEIFGDGSDGVGLFTANTTWNAETEDTGMIIKQFESLTISQGVTVSAGNRNCGMIVRVKGDCTIHGTLANQMSCKTLLDSDGVDFSMYPATLLTGTGGNGGAGGNSYWSSNVTWRGTGGSGMIGRFYGGGWSGGGAGGVWPIANSSKNAHGGTGGSTTSVTTAISNIFVGGAGQRNTGHGPGGAGSYGGGGGGASGSISITYQSYGYGGNGGSGAGSSGLPGNDSGGSTDAGAGGGGAGNYGGGIIILMVGGNLTITGAVNCSGAIGGSGGTCRYSTQAGGAGGGGGGGGRIFICHKGTISNTGTLNVNGGSGGTGVNYNGVNGGFSGNAGSIGTTAVKTYEQYLAEDVA